MGSNITQFEIYSKICEGLNLRCCFNVILDIYYVQQKTGSNVRQNTGKSAVLENLETMSQQNELINLRSAIGSLKVEESNYEIKIHGYH